MKVNSVIKQINRLSGYADLRWHEIIGYKLYPYAFDKCIYFAGSHFAKLGTEFHCELETTFTDVFPHHEKLTPLYNRNVTRMLFIYYSDSRSNDIGS